MDVAGSKEATPEPVGIVISRGMRDEPAPAFWTFVWGAAPEEPTVKPKAA